MGKFITRDGGIILREPDGEIGTIDFCFTQQQFGGEKLGQFQVADDVERYEEAGSPSGVVVDYDHIARIATFDSRDDIDDFQRWLAKISKYTEKYPYRLPVDAFFETQASDRKRVGCSAINFAVDTEDFGELTERYFDAQSEDAQDRRPRAVSMARNELRRIEDLRERRAAQLDHFGFEIPADHIVAAIWTHKYGELRLEMASKALKCLNPSPLSQWIGVGMETLQAPRSPWRGAN